MTTHSCVWTSRLMFLGGFLAIRIGAWACAEEAPAAPVIAEIDGVPVAEDKFDFSPATVMQRFGQLKGRGYNVDNPEDVRFFRRLKNELTARFLVGLIEEAARKKTVTELKCEASDEEVLAAQARILTEAPDFQEGNLDEGVKKLRQRWQAILTALQDVHSGAANAITAYERHLKGVMKYPEWLGYVETYQDPESVKGITSLLARKPEELLKLFKTPDETVRFVLSQRKMTNRVLVRLSRERSDVAEYLVRILDTPEKRFPWLEAKWVNVWIVQQCEKVPVKIVDPAVGEMVERLCEDLKARAESDMQKDPIYQHLFPSKVK